MHFAAATALYLLGAILYYRGRFALAGAAGIGYGGVTAWIVAGAMGPVGATVTLVLLAVLPAAALLVHVVDARRGIFLMPTVYAIPLAFACGLLLWLVTGLALVLR
jgi:hypothetical protein